MTPNLYHNDLFVLIHGLSSSKNEWFTEHKNLTDYFRDNSISFIALNLYGHGDFPADEPNFSADYIDDDLWPIFIDKSVAKITHSISIEDQVRSFTNVHIISYSIGSVVAIEVAKRITKCASLSLCVPDPDYSINDCYSLCNSVDQVNAIKTTIFSGIKDDEVPYKDIERLLEGHTHIHHHAYDAGHSLPTQWIDDLLNEFE